MEKIRFILLVLVVYLFSQSFVFAKEQVIIYGDDNYPPYSFEKNREPKGIYVKVLKSAFSDMPDYNVTIKMVPWKRGLAYIKRGQGLALFPPYYSEKRKQWMLFSEPILKEQVIVFGTKEKLNGKAIWPEDFYGYKIGLNRGFGLYAVGGDKFGDACKAGKIKIQEANNNDQNLKKIKYGRIDFYINDRLIDISQYPSIKRGVVANINYGYLGFTKKNEIFSFKSDFIEKFNRSIKKMKESGEIKKIIETYLNRKN